MLRLSAWGLVVSLCVALCIFFAFHFFPIFRGAYVIGCMVFFGYFSGKCLDWIRSSHSDRKIITKSS